MESNGTDRAISNSAEHYDNIGAGVWAGFWIPWWWHADIRKRPWGLVVIKGDAPDKRVAKALEALRRAILAVDNEIAQHGRGAGVVSNEEQLGKLRRELERMHQELALRRIPALGERRAGMGAVIVDSWPITSDLGRLIVLAERAYLQA